MTKHISWRWTAVIVGAAGVTMAIAGLSAQESCACRPARFWLGGAYMRSLVNVQLDHYYSYGVFSDDLSATISDALRDIAPNPELETEAARVQDYYTLSLKTTPTTVVIALTPRAEATKTITYQLLGQRLWERTVPADDVYGYVASLTVNPTRHLTGNSSSNSLGDSPDNPLGNPSSNSLGSEPTMAEPVVVICKAMQPGAIALPAPMLSENSATCSPGTRPE